MGNWLGLVGMCVALGLLPCAHVWAAGTLSGTSISNSAVIYCYPCDAGGISVSSTPFVVDNKVNVTVAEIDGAVTSVIASQSAAVTSFTVINNGNTAQDYGLATANAPNGAVLFAGTDNFDVTSCTVHVESGATPGYDGADSATFIDELSPDASSTVYVVCDIPGGQITGDQAIVSLTATTLQGGVSATQGGVIAETAGVNDPGAVDIVFADVAGSDDAARDGKHSGRDAYRVNLSNAVASLSKIVANIQDPSGCSAPPSATICEIVPGSVITYQIILVVTGLGNVDNLVLTDPVPVNMTYVPGSIVVNSVTKTDANDSDGADFGIGAPNAVTVNPGVIAAPTTYNFTFRAIIN